MPTVRPVFLIVFNTQKIKLIKYYPFGKRGEAQAALDYGKCIQPVLSTE